MPYTIATRHTDSGIPIEKAPQYIGEHLEALGLSVEYHDWSWGSYCSRNVIGELPGEVSPDDIVIISAHLDDLPSGPNAPGDDDNASGSAAVLVAADILSQYRRNCTLRFAFWTGEEQGLLGSYAYAERSFGQGQDIVGVLNLDMIGWDSEGTPPDIDVHAYSSMPATLNLTELFADVVDACNLDLVPQIVSDGTGGSDHASFWDFGYTAILGIEDFGDFNEHYHTVDDTMEYLNEAYFAEFIRASVGNFAHMADCLIPPWVYYLPQIVRHAPAQAEGLNAR